MWAALNRVLPPRRSKSAAEAISTRREAMTTRGESKPTNLALIAVARRLSFRIAIERTYPLQVLVRQKTRGVSYRVCAVNWRGSIAFVLATIVAPAVSVRFFCFELPK